MKKKTFNNLKVGIYLLIFLSLILSIFFSITKLTRGPTLAIGIVFIFLGLLNLMLKGKLLLIRGFPIKVNIGEKFREFIVWFIIVIGIFFILLSGFLPPHS